MITHLVKVPIFQCGVYFVGDCLAGEAIEAIFRLQRKRTMVALSDDNNGSVAVAGGDVFVWVKDMERGSVMLHELAHAACSIMETRGIPQCKETEEVMCYLIGWLKIHVMDKAYEKRSRIANSKEKI